MKQRLLLYWMVRRVADAMAILLLLVAALFAARVF
jgi:hypothetical protein